MDAVAHTLSRDGQPYSLEPKAFAVLLLLLRHAGELVERDQLLDAVWGHRHVTPGVLTRAIAQLRSALDDHPHAPRFIQTQHAMGYRFIGELQPARTAMAATASPSEETLALSLLDGPVVADEPLNVERAPPHEHAVPAEGTPPPGRAGGGWWRWLRQRRGRLLVGLALLLAVGGGVWHVRMPPSPPPSPPVRHGAVKEASIAVMPFRSLSDNADDRYFADGLAVEMQDALAHVAGLKVAAPQLAAPANATGEDVRRTGHRLGVATLLDATVRRDGDHVRISARLSDTRTGFTLWSDTYDREIRDVFALQSEIAQRVVNELLGRLSKDMPALAQRLAPTRDVSAYDAYLRGLSLLQRPVGETGNERAIGYFRQALTLDPHFARAQAGICRAEIMRLEGVSDAAAFDRARQACSRAQTMDPGLHEVSLAMAEIARVSGQNERALVLYGQAVNDPALRADAYVGLARTYGALGQDARALDYFQRAIAARPSDAHIYRLLGYYRWLRGDLPKAIDAFVTATILQPDDSRLWSSLGGLYLAQGDTAQAGRAFSMSLSIEPNAGALTNLGTMEFDQGNYAGAAEMFRRATVLEPQDYLHWGNLGDALAALPATAAQAQAPYRRAADLAQHYVDVRRDDAYALALLSWYRANLGEHERARAALRTARRLGTQSAEVALWCAQTLALLGDDTGARICIATALKEGIPRQRVDALLALRRFTDTTVKTAQK
ncbi:winged helix-turn-helix domain-containing protein [Stenotrophomonas sp. YIM B06876]|uniref:tetratricopeptide repeat protein n=1 Tax=Stenotrophomonas sp. YIM B06876 TaxID=3060211 RepID=UPI002739934A|nr:winged helix-turn-helix domain-containing protein [Stenotrophomonas sp. YIM B06876]